MEIDAPERLPSGASRPGAFARFLGRREPQCFLLEEGITPAELQCALCGVELALPHRGGRCFQLANPWEAAAIKRPHHIGMRLAVEGRMLVTGVNRRLIPLLERAKAFLGEDVLVAKALRRGGNKCQAFVFCARCGAGLLARVNREGERFYSWDRLVEIKPGRPLVRWLAALKPYGRRREKREDLTRSLMSRARPHRAGALS